MNIPSSIWTLLVGIGLTLVSLWYGQNHGLLPEAASEEAPLVDGLFNVMMTISTGLFLIVQGVLIFSAFKFRQKAGDNTDGPPVHGNIPLEILWTAIPAVIVLVLSVYSFEVYNSMGGLDPMSHSVAHAKSEKHFARMPGAAIAATLTDTENGQELPQLEDSPGITTPSVGSTPEKQGNSSELVVNAAGMQYAWIFTYPDTGITAGELHLPVNREVLVNISANDVLHAFWVPEFRLKQDAVPGRQSELVFTPNKLGEYPLICAELCGAYHGAMRTKVIVDTQENFDKWVVEQQEVARSEDLDRAVAVSADKSAVEFLAPYAGDIGVNAETLQHLHHSM